MYQVETGLAVTHAKLWLCECLWLSFAWQIGTSLALGHSFPPVSQGRGRVPGAGSLRVKYVNEISCFPLQVNVNLRFLPRNHPKDQNRLHWEKKIKMLKWPVEREKKKLKTRANPPVHCSYSAAYSVSSSLTTPHIATGIPPLSPRWGDANGTPEHISAPQKETSTLWVTSVRVDWDVLQQ